MKRERLGSVATERPDLALQAHGWDPARIALGSGALVKWQCNLGHVWSASPKNRNKGSSCPFCSGKKVLAGFNDLATTHPDLAAQAHGWDPTTRSGGTNLSVAWKCQLGHIWETGINGRVRGAGCPVCSGKKVLAGFNDLATTHPDLAAQAHGWDPTTVRAGSHKSVAWKCDMGHIWETALRVRLRGSGCPICPREKINGPVASLATTHPELAAQAHGWDPTTVTAGSSRKLMWLCNLGHTWEAVVYSRKSGKGCPVCANQRVLTGFNDLATTHPELAAQAHGWDPTTVTAISGKKRSWKCSLGHEWIASPAKRVWGRNCAICAGKTVVRGENDLATTHPELAAQAHGWDPTTVTVGSKGKLEWACQYNHLWTASIYNRLKANCPTCSGHQVLIGFNDLATTHPELAAQAHGWDPTTLTAGSNKKRGWVCSEGHTWQSVVSSRSAGTGCPVCAISGFNPSLDGWLYLIFSDARDMLQIGITNNPEDRLARHRRNGFDQVLDVRGPADGQLTQRLERDALNALRKRGAVFANKAGGKAFDGWSEAWLASSLSLTSLGQVLAMIYEDESPESSGRTKVVPTSREHQ